MIWCVEDDAGIREIELYALNSTGLGARGFEDGAAFWEALQTETPELVLLDVMLPGEDGVSLLRRCRPQETGHVLSAGGISLDPERRTVTVEGQRVQLTYKEFELLRLFLSRPGMAFTREQLYTQVWDMAYMDDSRTLDMHIRTLRQKLGNCGRLIETVRNVGYRLEAAP